MGQKILVADDEKEVVALLKLYLENSGYTVIPAYDGREAMTILQRERIDLAVLDIMMPEMDGYTVIRKIRETNNIPVIMLSAKGETSDKILGLGMGADDYITKPFDALEVVARISANLRRFSQMEEKGIRDNSRKYLTVKDLRLDTEACVLQKDTELIELTSIEYRMLKLFMESPGQVFTKKQIYEAAWGDEYLVDDNNIMVYISRIREKIGEYEGQSYIRTIRGLGYKMLP